jgi:hypothetical protein
MKKITIGGLIFLGVILLAGCGSSQNNTSQSTGSAGNGNAGAQTAAIGQKFSDQSYASRSFMISGDTLSADAQNALSGFQLSKNTVPDGTTQINLKALQPQYHDQSYTLKPGEQLYFIEKFMGDDVAGQDANINDDSAVVVDSRGNVVQGPGDFSK